MYNDAVKIYSKYHLERKDERLGLFLRLSEKYTIKKVLYPGSFVHLTPALVFPFTCFVDSDRRAGKFFDSLEVSEYVSNHKIYKSDAEFIFHLSDYNKGIPEQPNSFDLLISQYAGFVSQACKQYLKIGGIIVANNSHGDASMARFGYTAALALFLGIGSLWEVVTFFLDDQKHVWLEQTAGHPFDSILEQAAGLQRFLLDRGDEAQTLLKNRIV